MIPLEPYFAVLTNPDFLLANATAERLREFFASGEREVGNLLRRLGRWLRTRSRLVHAAASLREGTPRLRYMQMNTYDLGTVFRAIAAGGFSRSCVTVSSDGPLLSARIVSRREP